MTGRHTGFALAGLTGVVIGLAATLVGCSDDNPSKPAGTAERHLAGGGRSASDEPFAGGPSGSGPSHPGFAVPDSGYFPLFYADTDCQNQPGERLITHRGDWLTWWGGATACLDLVTPCGPPLAPEVDFERSAVVAISLPFEPAGGRGLWVTGVETGTSGTTISYTISRLGEDCFGPGGSAGPGGPGGPGGAGAEQGYGSPTLAAMVPGPLSEPITWAVDETILDCEWTEDPNQPVTLYYTDGDCVLGPRESVVREREVWDAWLDLAFQCDQARWYGSDSTLILYPEGHSGRGDPGACSDTLSLTLMPTSPAWWGADVDFATHAVLILRAGEQFTWGGGIWLDAIDVGEHGTTIQYTVMSPGPACPPAEGLMPHPTAAIRVPLPLREPILWLRNDETIDCRWSEPVAGGGGEASAADTRVFTPLRLPPSSPECG